MTAKKDTPPEEIGEPRKPAKRLSDFQPQVEDLPFISLDDVSALGDITIKRYRELTGRNGIYLHIVCSDGEQDFIVQTGARAIVDRVRRCRGRFPVTARFYHTGEYWTVE